MDFPSNDCERRVLRALKMEASHLSFGLLHYIHAACNAGFPDSIIATHCARALSWPRVLNKLKTKHSNLVSSPLIEKELHEKYIASGATRSFLKRLSQFLDAAEGNTTSVERLNSNMETTRQDQRREIWRVAMEVSESARNMRFEEELRFDFELSDTDEWLSEQLQRRLMEMAVEESEARAVMTGARLNSI